MHIAIAGAIALAATHAWSEEGTWGQVRALWLAHPRLEASRATAREAAADAAFAGRAPSWNIEIAAEDFGGSGERAGFGGSTQELWASREFRLRPVARTERELARTDVEAVALDTLMLRRALVVEGRRRFEDWMRSRKTVALLDSQIAEARLWLEAARRERGAGKTPAWVEHRLTADLAGLESRRRAVSREAASRWAFAVAPGGATLPEPADLPVENAMTESVSSGAAPDSVMMEARHRLAVAGRALAEASEGPVLEAAGGVLRDQATGDLGLGVRLALPLPWGRVDWQGAKARSAVRIAERERAVAAQERARRRADLATRISMARTELEDLRGGVLPALAQARVRIDSAWAGGSVGWTERKDAREAWWEARAKEQELEAARRGLELERMELEGVEP